MLSPRRLRRGVLGPGGRAAERGEQGYYKTKKQQQQRKHKRPAAAARVQWPAPGWPEGGPGPPPGHPSRATPGRRLMPDVHTPKSPDLPAKSAAAAGGWSARPVSELPATRPPRTAAATSCLRTHVSCRRQHAAEGARWLADYRGRRTCSGDFLRPQAPRPAHLARASPAVSKRNHGRKWKGGVHQQPNGKVPGAQTQTSALAAALPAALPAAASAPRQQAQNRKKKRATWLWRGKDSPSGAGWPTFFSSSLTSFFSRTIYLDRP